MTIKEFANEHGFLYHTVYLAMKSKNCLRAHESDVNYPKEVILDAMLTYLNSHEEKFLKKANEYTQQIDKLLSEVQK